MQAIKQRYRALAWRPIGLYCVQDGASNPNFDIKPDYYNTGPNYTGSFVVNITSDYPWTASMVAIEAISGSVTATPLSGSALTDITVNMNAAKGNWELRITSNGETRICQITTD